MANFQDLADGTYRGRPVGATLSATRKEKPYVLVELELKGEGVAGTRCTRDCYLSEKALDRTMESLRYCGWEGDDIADLSSVGKNADIEVDVVLKKEKDDKGRWSQRVQWINKAGSVSVGAPLDTVKAAALSAALRGAAAASRAKAKMPPSNSGDTSFDFGANGK